MLKGTFSLVVIVFIALAVLAFVFGITVPPGMMGVRQVNFGPNQGMALRGLPPGFHWKLPFYSDVLFVPQNLQSLDFHSDTEQVPEQTIGDVFPPLEIQTADRATVEVEATILYRFYTAPSGSSESVHHGGPKDLIMAAGSSRAAWVNKVKRAADDSLKRALGELATGEFYNPEAREKQVTVAIDLMNGGSTDYKLTGLAHQGIEVAAILLRRYTYKEERIENAIFQKNLQDQEEALSIAQGEFAKAQALSAEEEAKGEARNQTLRIRGEQDAAVLRSEADLEETKKKAEADLLIARARAESDRLKAAAFSKGIGSDVLVAREMGPLLQSLKGGVVTNVDPYDLEAWMKRFGLSDKAIQDGRAE